MLSSSWSRPARRPARGGPHALCRLSDLPSLSLLRIPLPLRSFHSLSFLSFLSGWFSALSGWFPEKAHSHFDSSSSTLSLLSFLPFATTTYRPIFFFFFFPVSCTRVQEGKVKSKRGERKGEERIKYWILLLAVSYLFFLFFDLCNFVPLRVTRVSTLPVLLLLLSLPLVLFPLLLFVVLVVEEARKNAPFLRISLGMLFIRIRVFFCPFFPSIFLLWSLEGISISRVRGELREIELGSSNPLTHSSACLFSRVLIDSANYSLEHPTPFGLWIRVNFRWNCYFSQCVGFRNIYHRYRITIDLFSIMKITGTIII